MGVMTGGTMDFVYSIEHKIGRAGQDLAIGPGIRIRKRNRVVVLERRFRRA